MHKYKYSKGLVQLIPNRRMQVWFLSSLSWLRVWHCHDLQHKLKTCPGSCVAVAVASSCRSDSTPSLGTSICHRCIPKKQKKRKRKKKRLRCTCSLLLMMESHVLCQSTVRTGSAILRYSYCWHWLGSLPGPGAGLRVSWKAPSRPKT